ncbi:MAG: hypothetical protein HY938_00200 [Nitrosomonadales bacterium]|nr:hypothetical protein [Nitrosomonadales bacterium]
MQTQKLHAGIYIFGLLFGMLLAGCGANVGKAIRVSDEQLAKYDTLSAEDAIAALAKRIEEARSANMPFLAPNYFKEASEILDYAHKQSAKKSRETLIGDIAKADALLDKGQAVMATVQIRFAAELEQKNLLDKHNGSRIYPKEYEKTISQLSDLIEKIELNAADDIEKDRFKLLKNMQDLVVKTVQYNTLHESDVINEDTQKKDGKKLAPATLAEALRVYQDAMSRIAGAPLDEASVKRAGDDAMFAALHARHVSERVLFLQDQFKKSVEQIVLDEEKLLLDISAGLGHKDPRDLPLEKQAEELARFAREIVPQTNTKPADGGANSQQPGAGEPVITGVNPPPSVQVKELPANDLPSGEPAPATPAAPATPDVAAPATPDAVTQ